MIKNFFNDLNIYKIILIIVLFIITIIIIKTIIEEVVKLGVKGLFVGLPKALYKLILFIPKTILYILKLIYGFIKRFFKALRICIFGVN